MKRKRLKKICSGGGGEGGGEGGRRGRDWQRTDEGLGFKLNLNLKNKRQKVGR